MAGPVEDDGRTESSTPRGSLGESCTWSTVVPDKSAAPLPATLGAILSVEQTGLGNAGLRELISRYNQPKTRAKTRFPIELTRGHPCILTGDRTLQAAPKEPHSTLLTQPFSSLPASHQPASTDADSNASCRSNPYLARAAPAGAYPR